MISYEGLEEAAVIHALYHAQIPPGMRTPAGVISMFSNVTIESVRADIEPPGNGTGYINYYHGRALNLRLDGESKTFDERLFDRDAGQGAAQRAIDALRAKGTP